MDSRVSIPLLSPFTSYLEWKLKIISYLNKKGLYEISIGAGEESYEELSDLLNDCDREIGPICLAISPSMRYLTDYVEYPKDIWTTLDGVLGKDNEDPSSYVEGASSSSMISLSQDVLASTVSDEVDHEEEVSHIVLVSTTLFDSNASSFNQEENIKLPSFSVPLEVEDLDSSSYDVVDEKEVTNGAIISIDDSLTHSVFSMSSIMDSEIQYARPLTLCACLSS